MGAAVGHRAARRRGVHPDDDRARRGARRRPRGAHRAEVRERFGVFEATDGLRLLRAVRGVPAGRRLRVRAARACRAVRRVAPARRDRARLRRACGGRGRHDRQGPLRRLECGARRRPVDARASSPRWRRTCRCSARCSTGGRSRRTTSSTQRCRSTSGCTGPRRVPFSTASRRRRPAGGRRSRRRPSAPRPRRRTFERTLRPGEAASMYDRHLRGSLHRPVRPAAAARDLSVHGHAGLRLRRGRPSGQRPRRHRLAVLGSWLQALGGDRRVRRGHGARRGPSARRHPLHPRPASTTRRATGGARLSPMGGVRRWPSSPVGAMMGAWSSKRWCGDVGWCGTSTPIGALTTRCATGSCTTRCAVRARGSRRASSSSCASRRASASGSGSSTWPPEHDERAAPPRRHATRTAHRRGRSRTRTSTSTATPRRTRAGRTATRRAGPSPTGTSTPGSRRC